MEVGMIENWFTYHSPREDQLPKYERVRQAGKYLALVINEVCPDSADKMDAFRKVREAVMTANASIALDGRNG